MGMDSANTAVNAACFMEFFFFVVDNRAKGQDTDRGKEKGTTTQTPILPPGEVESE